MKRLNPSNQKKLDDFKTKLTLHAEKLKSELCIIEQNHHTRMVNLYKKKINEIILD